MEPNCQLALAAARKAVELDPNDAGTHWGHSVWTGVSEKGARCVVVVAAIGLPEDQPAAEFRP